MPGLPPRGSRRCTPNGGARHGDMFIVGTTNWVFVFALLLGFVLGFVSGVFFPLSCGFSFGLSFSVGFCLSFRRWDDEFGFGFCLGFCVVVLMVASDNHHMFSLEVACPRLLVLRVCRSQSMNPT
jgi:hypothetical protein